MGSYGAFIPVITARLERADKQALHDELYQVHRLGEVFVGRDPVQEYSGAMANIRGFVTKKHCLPCPFKKPDWKGGA